MKLSELLIEPEVNLELAPLIDVLFLIVLFYAVSSSLISPEDLDKLQGSLAAAVSENHTLVERVKTREAKLDQIESDLSRRTGELAERDTRLARLRAELDDSATQLTRRGAEITEARDQIGKLRTGLSDAESKLSERETRLTRLQEYLDIQSKALAERERVLAEQAKRIVIADQSLDDLRAKLSQSQGSADQQAKQAADAQAVVVRLEAESRQLAESLAKEKAAHEADLAAAAAELERTRLQLTAISAENAKFVESKKAETDRTAGMVEAQKKLSENLKSLIDDKSLGVSRVKDRLVLELSDKILFDSGSDQLRPEGLPVLANVAKILASRVQTLQIQVGGHTDNVPLGSTGRFGSNWALSAARAVNVVRFLAGSGGIEASRMSAVGYGEFQPVTANTTPEGRARNRRIEIVLLAK
ncbi:MAG: OmpA family protein [Rhodospirillaceae bacterium]